MEDVILQVKNLHKIFKIGEVPLHVIKGISLDIFEGEFLVILGPSGSGKSTVLNILGGLDQLSSGELYFRGSALHQAKEPQLTNFRREHIGFVFQFYNLIGNLSAIENIKMSAQLSKDPIDAETLINQIGLADKRNHYPAKLSGGQQQRIAIARALAKNPDLLLCDEPTGALDAYTGMQVLELLKDFNRRYGKTVVIITHNSDISKIADRSIYIKDGVIDRVDINPDPVNPGEVAW